MINCSIGIMAYNEEANIGRLLEALISQELRTVRIKEIIVVASGCTDRTEEIVRAIGQREGRVQLLRQSEREGKASAVNLLLHHVSSKIVVLESADTLPAPAAIENLVAPFKDAGIGMTGGHPIPTNSDRDFMGFGVHLLWDLHHQLSLHYPKMGELTAFRKVFTQIPAHSAVDEASIEPLIVGQGLRLAYVPEAVVYNRGPNSVSEFFKQRRRIFIGHLYVKDMLGYKVSTMNGLRIFWLFLTNLCPDWRYWVWGPVVGMMELIVRLLARYDYAVRKRNPYVWPIAESTKDLSKLRP